MHYILPILTVLQKMRADTGFIDELDKKNKSFVAEFRYHLSYPTYSQINLQCIGLR
jgi:hypothetical protein